MERHSSAAFTLIELLVVITILVVLLALLAPAMDKAVYAAELATCGAKLKAVGGSIQLYAMGSHRRYPDRGLPTSDGNTTQAFIPPTALNDPLGSGYDMRPRLQQFMDINRQLQCPLNKPVELVNIPAQDKAFSSYTMWWGWRYDIGQGANPTKTKANAGTYSGMYKVGDRWAYLDDQFAIVAGDFDLDRGADDAVQGSHPDADGLMAPLVAQSDSQYGVGAGDVQAVPMTLSWWGRAGSNIRGVIDMNHVYDDGSVRRFNAVSQEDWRPKKGDRMARVPNQFDDRQPGVRYQVPRN